jgi:hypothetical protein
MGRARLPGGWAQASSCGQLDFFPALIEQHVDLHKPIRVDDELIVLGWCIDRQHPRLRSGVALLDPDGTPPRSFGTDLLRNGSSLGQLSTSD